MVAADERERVLPRSQSFCLSSKLFYFASAATDLQTEKILGLHQKNSCFCNSAYLFISFKTHSLIQYLTIIGKDEIHFIPSPSRHISHIQYICGKHKIRISPSLPRISLSFSTIVAKIRCIISFQLHQDIFFHSGQLCKDKDLWFPQRCKERIKDAWLVTRVLCFARNCHARGKSYMKSKLPILLEPDKFLQVLPLWIIHSSADAVQKGWSEQ